MFTTQPKTIQATVTGISHPHADIWIAADSQKQVDYCYGGTRMVPPSTNDDDAIEMLKHLMWSESTFKNHLINIAFRHHVLQEFIDDLPQRLQASSIGGARCLIRPKTPEIYKLLKNPDHPDFLKTISPIFEQVAQFLNDAQGRVKLTPDFGRFAGLADILAKYTPHVLGIRCEDGGCGGKSSYATSGVIAAFKYFEPNFDRHTPLTLIGSAGAIGTDLVRYFLEQPFDNVAVCDLVYDDPASKVTPPERFTHLPAVYRRFTDACLQRGGCIIASTVGQELENSNWQCIPAGTTLLLAHNLAIPHGEDGLELMRQIAARDILAIPGQLLTLGGALTSRIEWFWRQSRATEPFDKQLAHQIVQATVYFLCKDIMKLANDMHITPYEATLLYTDIM